MTTRQPREDSKFIAIFHAVAVGDALGLPYEQRGCVAQEDSQGHIVTQTDGFSRATRFAGEQSFPCGQVSDDTEMMIALLHSFPLPVQSRVIQYDRNATILAYLKWANSRCPFMGKNTRAHLQGIKTLRGYTARITQSPLRELRAQSFSNGALMRCAPLVLFAAQEEGVLERAVSADCSITNPALCCIVGEILFLRIMNAFLRESSRALSRESRSAIIIREAERRIFLPEFARGYAVPREFPEVAGAIDDALEGKPRNIVENRGFFAHALYCAFYCATHFDTLTETFDWVIRGRKGTDPDTNAAIAGALVASFADVDHDEVYTRNLRAVLGCSARDGDIHRCDEYHAGRIANILHALLD